MDKPSCGGTAIGDTQFGNTTTVISAILAILGGLTTAYGIATSTTVIALLGFLVPLAVVAAALAGGLGVLVIVLVGGYSTLAPRQGIHECYAGVVAFIQEAFSDGWSIYFPFTAQHDRVDVVVKPLYWDVVARSPQLFIWCNVDSLASPMIRSYFRTPEVVGAVSGAMYGAGVGAAIGICLGIAAGAAIGCLGIVTILLCLIAILLALLIAAVIALIGAFIGGSVGRLAAGPSSPSGSVPGGDDKTVIRTGDYLSVNANLVVFPDDKTAWVAWWTEHVTLHGHSTHGEGTGGGPPFNFADARDNLEPDACPRRVTDSEPEPPR
jgi:hypothetical protein